MITYDHIPKKLSLDPDNSTLDAIMYILAKIGNKIDIPFQTLISDIKCVQKLLSYTLICVYL